jgi:hypothetical protein
MRWACMVATWAALALVTAAWTCRLVWIATPALDAAGQHAAEALYLAELDQQYLALPISTEPTIESIATAVHRRAVRVLVWIGLGLGLCLIAFLSSRSRRAATVASGLLFLLGWVRLDAYAHVGLIHGLDQKLRLVQDHGLRLVQFIVVDAVLPLVVTCAVVTTVLAALRRA